MGRFFVGSVRTSNYTAWVIYVHHPIDPVWARLIDDWRTRLKVTAANFASAKRATLYEHKEGHDRKVLELACH